VRNGELEIHSLSAQPEKQKLGSILIHEAAKRAQKSKVNHIVALLVAKDATSFYASMGFQPIVIDDPHHPHAANYRATTENALDNSTHALKGAWVART
jgi:N-acetylglutamate synthase-like GNAT family acetyltransferase